MTGYIGPSKSRLDEIELRHLAADFQPWIFDGEWHSVIMGQSAKARKLVDAAKAGLTSAASAESFSPRGRHMHDALSICDLDKKCSDELGEFIAKSPADIEWLMTELKCCVMAMEGLRKERDEFRKEALASRVETAQLREKLTAVRSAWRSFTETVK